MTTTIDKLRYFQGLFNTETVAKNFLSLCAKAEAELQQMKDNYTGQYIEMRKYREEIADLKKQVETLTEYAEHTSDCILGRWEAGERYDSGCGYRLKFGGKWYDANEQPKCECGLDEALKGSL